MPGEGAVAQRSEAEPAHQRPARVDEGPQQDLDQQVQVVFLGARHEEVHQQGQGSNRCNADNSRGTKTQYTHDLAPNRPCGRMKMATMKNRKATA